MKGKNSTLFLLLVVFVIFSAAMGGGCANPIAPQGGPRDTLPPVLVEAFPKDSLLNFTDNKITVSFNEFIQLDNWRQNVIISPLPKQDPEITSKLRTITIRIKDTLEPNTTYSYDFGKSIKDVNEGNVAKNFTYIFSTGKYLDSLELTGKVLVAQTGKPDSTLIVMLHRNGVDSIVRKQKPRYVATLDSAGRFHFRNLAPGVFYLYALKDQSGQRLHTGSEAFAFADKPVTIGKSNAPDTLYAFEEKQDEKALVKKAVTPNTPGTKTEKPKEKEKDKRLKFTINLQNGQQDLLSNLEFVFPDALKNFDSSKAKFTTADFKPITNYTFTKDTSNKKLTLVYKWPEDTKFNLIVDKDFAEDSTGRKIPRTDTLRFTTMKESDYGNVTLQFNNLDLSKKPVLQLMQGEDVKFHVKLTSNKFHDALFKPGDYDIRILYDDNDNGVWDTGEFFGKHRQPEHVVSVKKKLTVKANWDNDVTIEL